MSEAGSGSTATYTPIPRHWYAVTIASIMWVLTILSAIADIVDHFPRAIVYTAGAAASCVTLLGALMWFDSVTRLRYAGLAEGVGELARQVEQISAKVPTAEGAFDAGRLYAEVTTNRERPGPRAVRDN